MILSLNPFPHALCHCRCHYLSTLYCHPVGLIILLAVPFTCLDPDILVECRPLLSIRWHQDFATSIALHRRFHSFQFSILDPIFIIITVIIITITINYQYYYYHYLNFGQSANLSTSLRLPLNSAIVSSIWPSEIGIGIQNAGQR